jgi:hypothetical protein
MQLPLHITKILLAAIALPLLSSFYVFISSPEDVAAARHTTRCSQVVQEKSCEKEVDEECKGKTGENADRCEANIVKQAKYSDVYEVCREKADPQKCHAAVKKANCGDKPTQAEQTRCKEDAANRFSEPKAKQTGSFTFGEKPEAKGVCGEGENAVETRFDFGCTGEGTPIQDFAYAIIRFLSVGVGLVLVASIIYAGIQYSSSEGNPEATQAAKKRIQNAIIGLIFYLFIFALVQYLVPGGLFD